MNPIIQQLMDRLGLIEAKLDMLIGLLAEEAPVDVLIDECGLYEKPFQR